MRLTELDPHWITEARAPGADPDWPSGGHYEDRVTSQAEAQGVRFLCPKCYAARGGPVGVHSVIVPFRDRGFPDAYLPGMARWQASGTNLEDLTTTPSILLTGPGCGWHGFITNGDVSVI